LVRIIEDFIDHEKLSAKYGDLVFEDKMEVDMRDGVDQVRDMVASLSDDDEEDENDDDEDDDEDDEDYIEGDDDEDELLYDDINSLDDLDDEDLDAAQLERQGLKVSYIKEGAVLEGSDALQEVSKDARQARRQEQEDEQEVVEMVSLLLNKLIYY
jgi:hypothetical protein